jgi:ATP-dependent HslUV protease ATP-binding subunit HslU
MIGSTGIGKTEIARRLARLSNSPFLKVEASKFTEVGYVGRDVESMIRDLVEIGVDLVREEKIAEVEEKAEQNAEERMLDLLLPRTKQIEEPENDSSYEQFERTREKLRQQLREGRLNARIVELEVQEPTQVPKDARRRGDGVSDPGRRAKVDRHGSGRSIGYRTRRINGHHISR